MRTRRIVSTVFFVVFFIMFSLISLQGTQVQAGPTDTSVLNNPPTGITLDKYFVKGTFSGNAASVVQNSNGADVVRLTSGISQTGSIWSDSANTNYLDVTKKQTISMWMYFGLMTTDVGIPDGMAFVLQNDSRGAEAISKNDKTINNGQSLGVWGMDSTYMSTQAIADQAIQKSFAIEFDTFANRNSKYNWKPGDPVSQLNGRGSSFDTMPYNDAMNNYLRGPHMAWNYPALATTYKDLGSGYMGMYHNLGTDSSTNGAGVDFSYRKLSSNTYKDAWKHMTITYIPNSDGKTAKVHYTFKDKKIDGTPKSPEVNATANIDLSIFSLGSSKKLRYGFTAATGPSADISNMVVFESMPSLVDAEANAYTVDKTTNTRISNSSSNIESNQNPDLFGENDQNLTTAKTVHPNDNLTLNYMLNYLSGEEATNGVKTTINIPSNVTITPDAAGNIGKIHYTNANDSKDVSIAQSSLNNGVLTSNIDSLSDEDGTWNAARIELNAKANDLPANTTKLNVPSTLGTFEGKNIKIDAQSDSFDIVKPANELIITTDMADPIQVQLDNKFNLTGQISFKNPGPTIDKNDMDIYYQIDDLPVVRTKDTSAGSDFTIYDLETGSEFGQLDVGDHTIKVQVVDNNYPNGSDVDTIGSNVLEYHIKVTNQSVIVTPDKDEITVNDNDPLKLTGTYLHSDGTTTTDEKGTSVVSYTITNEGETTQKEVSDSQTNDGNYSLTLKPYAYDKDASVSLDDYTGNTGLKVGKNIVSINVVDQEGHKSESKDVIVNVPDFQPILTTDNDVLNVIKGDSVDLLGNVSYNGDYQIVPSKLTWYINSNGHKTINSYSGDESVATPVSQQFTVDTAANEMTSADTPYTVSIYFTDPYGRKSDSLDYTINIIEKTAMLESDDYKFQDINSSNSPKVVKRSGTWDLQVKSVMSKWVLTAKASKMYTGVDSDKTALDGNLIYVSPDNEINDMSGPTFIDRNDDDTTEKITDIGGDWAPDQGVLLDVNSSPIAGTYAGKVEWNLTSSL